MADEQKWKDQAPVENPSLSAEVVIKVGEGQFGRTTIGAIAATAVRGGPAQFDDFFEERPYYERGGGYYDITAAYSREGGQRAVKQGDMITWLPNLAPAALGGPAALYSFVPGGKTLPLEFRRDVRYSSDPEQPQSCEYLHDIPMMFPSAAFFAQLNEAASGGEGAEQTGLLMGMLAVFAADTGLDTVKASGLTIALVCSTVLAPLIELGAAESVGALGGSGVAGYGYVPGVTIISMDFELFGAGDPSGMRFWRNGEAVTLEGGMTPTPGQTAEDILAQFLLPDGKIMLGGAGTLCAAVQKILLLTRVIDEEEALDITERWQGAMAMPDPDYVPEEEVCTIHMPPVAHIETVRIESPPGTVVHTWNLDVDMPMSVVTRGGDPGPAVVAWLLEMDLLDVEGELVARNIEPPYSVIVRGTDPTGEVLEATILEDLSEPQIYAHNVRLMSDDGSTELSLWGIGFNLPESVMLGTPEEVLSAMMPYIDVVTMVNDALTSWGINHTALVELLYTDADGNEQTFALLTDYTKPAPPLYAQRYYMLNEAGDGEFTSWSIGYPIPAETVAAGEEEIINWINTVWTNTPILAQVRGMLSYYGLPSSAGVRFVYLDAGSMSQEITLYDTIYPLD